MDKVQETSCYNFPRKFSTHKIAGQLANCNVELVVTML